MRPTGQRPWPPSSPHCDDRRSVRPPALAEPPLTGGQLQRPTRLTAPVLPDAADPAVSCPTRTRSTAGTTASP